MSMSPGSMPMAMMPPLRRWQNPRARFFSRACWSRKAQSGCSQVTFLVRVGLGQNANQRGDGLTVFNSSKLRFRLAARPHVGNFMHALHNTAVS